MELDLRRKRLLWRADHRGIKEADILVGSFARKWLPRMDEPALSWFESLLDEQDVDILAWATGEALVPDCHQGPMIAHLQALDYMPHRQG